MKQTIIQRNKNKSSRDIITSSDYKIVRGLINTIIRSGVSLEFKSLFLTMIDVEFHKHGIAHISRRILSEFVRRLRRNKR